MIVLFTDFGRNGPYQGLMENAIYRIAPSVKVIDLVADAPSCDMNASAHLLAALVSNFDQGTLFLSVVDPGVGGAREPCIVCADGYWFVGPNNGLFSVITSRAKEVCWWRITWRPESLSETFHGRDLFAPVAAHLALDVANIDGLAELSFDAKPLIEESPYRVIYIDDYGNVMTSIVAEPVARTAQIKANGQLLPYAKTFSDCGREQGFWYCNSLGLVEIAINGSSAARELNCVIGDRVDLIKSISS